MPGRLRFCAVRKLETAGVQVDRTACDLGFEDTVKYLERKISGYDIVVSCQGVADIHPAVECLRHHPPLIERGGLVSEALSGPRHFTTRFAGFNETIRAAAASRMADRPHHALAIPWMVSMSPFDGMRRGLVRAGLNLSSDAVVIGWMGRLEPRQGVEGFLRAAAVVRIAHPTARFLVVGGPDALMPEYAAGLHELASDLGMVDAVFFAGDRPDVPDPMCAMDAVVVLSGDEGMSCVIGEAGAAALPVIAATADDFGGVAEVRDGESGLLVPHQDVPAIAAAMDGLVRSPALRWRLGQTLHAHIAATRATEAVVPRWESLFAEVLAQASAPPATLFRSFVQGGFECSTHRLRNGRRLDVIASIDHDTHAESDYRQLAGLGLRTVRDGTRWHLIEPEVGRFDFSSLLPMVDAARNAGTQVIWDLMHYGWPDDIDIWAPSFVDRFAAFARATARALRERTDDIPFWCPVNEISFFSWAGGNVQYPNPFATGRGFELKVQLARASIAAMHALREVDPRARFVHCEPLIAVHHDPTTGRQRSEAEGWHQAQFQAFELLMGRLWPQIGGDPSFLDIVGLNYYPRNQWIHGGAAIDLDHPLYRPLSDLLFEAHARYGRPVFVAETGVEGDRRAHWFRYVAAEVARARRRGVPIEGICLYPVANHPGWDDDRACPNGLLSQHLVAGKRVADSALSHAVSKVVSETARNVATDVAGRFHVVA